VLRLVRGEDLETLSRALGVTAATLIGWQDSFLAAGEASLATRPPNGEALETVNRAGFPGGGLAWVRRPRPVPRPGHSNALPPRREARSR